MKKLAANNIAAALNMAPIIENSQNLPAKLSDNVTIMPVANQDFDTARSNLLDIIEGGNIALRDLSDLASQSQDWKYYKTLGEIMKTMVDANKTLLELQKNIKDLNKEDIKVDGESSGNVNVIVCTTDDLKKILEKYKEND